MFHVPERMVYTELWPGLGLRPGPVGRGPGPQAGAAGGGRLAPEPHGIIVCVRVMVAATSDSENLNHASEYPLGEGQATPAGRGQPGPSHAGGGHRDGNRRCDASDGT